MSLPELKHPEVHYPESDGKPMAETDLHRDLMVNLIEAAKHHFREVQDVYVSGNIFLYYQEGDSRKNVSPDVLVVRGIPKGRRRVFKLWVEGRPPDLVIELTSENTRLEDLGNKRAIYEEIGVKEYFVFDPETKSAERRFRGFRLKDRRFEALQATISGAGEEVFSSEALGFEIHASEGSIRWVDPRRGEPLLVPSEALERVERERRRAEAEKQRADEADRRRAEERQRAIEVEERREAEIRRLKEEIARLRGMEG